jgi:hypothetical protein
VLNGGGNGTTFYDSATFPVTLENVTVTGGSTSSYLSFGSGGGIYNGGNMTVADSTISGNTANYEGGGIYNNGGNMTVADSTISGNTAGSNGGGISNAGNMTVADSTISENIANAGGGISNAGNMTVADSTISGNTAAAGGGIYNISTMTVAGSIVANQSSGSNCYGSLTDAGYNLSSGTSCKFGTTSDSTSKDSVTNLDLGSLADNGGPTETIAIPGSSAAAAFISSPATVTLGGISINLCSDTSYTTSSGYKANLSVDQRGVSRPATGCSAGAYQAT